MNITFLGTGTSQGVPVIACECPICLSLDFRDKRLRSSVLVELPELTLVIDTGPDFRQQMLRERVKDLDAVLFTHQHKDHIAGLDDIRAFNFLHNKDIPIYAENHVMQQLSKEFAYAFKENKYPGVPLIIPREINETSFDIKGNKIVPIRVMHYRLPVLGFRIGDFVYITDAKTIPEEEKNKIRNCKCLVLNAVHQDEHHSHFNLNEAINMANELEAEQTWITHISHRMGLHQVVEQNMPDHVKLAWDGLKISC